MNQYLQKHAFTDELIHEKPHNNLKMVVVIPCYNEPALLNSLVSIIECDPPKYAVEVIVVINQPENESDEVINNNNNTYYNALKWAKNHSSPMLGFYILNLTFPPKHAGVGLARKTGMDEAIRRFEKTGDHNNKIIVCFDADSQCEANYLQEIEKHFEENQHTPGCSIFFKHPLEGSLDQSVYDGIIRYELYLRYYIEALRMAGHPHAFHAIGSSMAVRANIYQKQGGMNKRKAGEDFYFLHKIIPLGGFTELNTTSVIPSPRNSERVPFGTGRAISDWLKEKNITAYNLNTFYDIKKFIKKIPEFYNNNETGQIIANLPPAINQSLNDFNFNQNLKEIKSHVSNMNSFQKRFFRWFNGFRVLKLVHKIRDDFYYNKPVFQEASKLLKEKGTDIAEYKDEKSLLIKYREIEKNQ